MARPGGRRRRGDRATAGLGDTDDIADVVYRLSEEGVSLLVVEHDLGFAFDVSDHTYIVYEGNIVADGPSETVRNDDEIKRTYLSV